MEAIVGLPTDMFYDTGISTCVWILSNQKLDDRKGDVQLIDASSFWQKMRKSLGSKRKEMSEAHIATVTRLFGSFTEADLVTVLDATSQPVGEPQLVTNTDPPPTAPEGGRLKRVPIARIFRNEEFGYTTITVERPLRDKNGQVVTGARGKLKGKPLTNSALRDKLYRLRLADELCLPTYLAAYLGTRQARSQIELEATGASSSMLNIGQAVVLDLPTPLPSVKEQEAILEFIDAEAERLDALNAEALRAIALLKERRTALIAAAVTGQIDVRGAVPQPAMQEELTA